MKKKLMLSIIAIVAVFAVILTGCSNTPAYKTLSIMWNAKEVAVYQVERVISEQEKIVGTLTIEIEKIKSPSVVVGDMTIDGLDGIATNLVTKTLEMENGDYEKSQVLMKSSFQLPDGNSVASYKTSKIKQSDGVFATSIVSAKYDNKNNKYNYYTTDAAGNKSEEKSISTGKFEKTPYYDNEVLYQILRCVYIDPKKGTFNFGFNVPSWNENKMLSLSATTQNSKIKIKTKETTEREVECFAAIIRLNQSFPGSGIPMIAYFTIDPLAAEGGDVKRALITIQEGIQSRKDENDSNKVIITKGTTYTLKSITTVLS